MLCCAYNIVTSIVRFHLHFHLSRFMRNPKLLDEYITKDNMKPSENSHPLTKWGKKERTPPMQT
jgi:hypothetical protein